MYLEPLVEPHFHPDSYGYRPKKSALQAVGVARGRCWRFDWVVDLDIQGFFDNLDHALVMRAVEKYTDCRWVLLYIERWLKAPAQSRDGILTARAKGTPQGGVASPLLANIFLHLAFDDWMGKTHPEVPFERYADDVIAHCASEEQAQAVKRSIEARLRRCKLELHPEKTKIVYCKDDDRRGSYPNEKFDFLGYTFRARRSKNRWGKYFINFSPAVSNQAATKMRREMRRWRLHLRSDKALDDLAHMWNPVLRGWINYYGRFYKSALHPVFRQLNRTNTKGYGVINAERSIGSAEWPDESLGCLLIGSSWASSRRLDDGSRMSGDVQVRLCVQRRLARSAGDSPAKVRARSLVARMAGRRETNDLKPIDRVIVRMTASHRAAAQANAQVAPKVKRPRRPSSQLSGDGGIGGRRLADTITRLRRGGSGNTVTRTR